jgi:DNA repair protein RadC
MTLDTTNAPSIDGATLQRKVPEMRLVRESSAPVTGFDRKPHLPSPEACARFLAPFAAREYAETLWLLPLDPVNRLTTAGPVVVSRGAMDATLAHSREIFRAAIVANAHHIVLAHNHPTGDLTPSMADLRMAKNIEQAGDIIGIAVQGNMILTPDGQFRPFDSSTHYRETPDAPGVRPKPDYSFFDSFTSRHRLPPLVFPKILDEPA